MDQEPIQPESNGRDFDLWQVLDEEVSRLPEKYRTAVVLCDLQGKTHEQAARLLGCPKATVSVRLMRARERLRTQLTRRGLAIPAAAVATALGGASADASLPAALASTTVNTIAAFSSGGVAPASIITLSQGVLSSMLFSKLKVASMIFAAACVLGVAAGTLTLRGRPAEAGSAQAAAATKAIDGGNEDLVRVPALREGVLAFIGTPVEGQDGAREKTAVTTAVGDRTITYVPLHKGDRVEAGQLLAQLNDRMPRSEIEIAKAKIKVAESDERASIATREEAKVRHDRQVKLWQSSATSKEDMDAARLTWTRYIEEAISKHEAVEQARAELKKAEVDVDLYQIRSPVRGVIRSIKKHTGEAVKQFDTVFELEPSSGR